MRLRLPRTPAHTIIFFPSQTNSRIRPKEKESLRSDEMRMHVDPIERGSTFANMRCTHLHTCA